jgi:hypothetical protein
MLEVKALTLIKIEGTYGTDPTPTGGADAVITGPVSWSITSADIQRKSVLPYFGELPHIPVGTGIDLSFNVEMFGSGAAATAPKPHGLLLRALGFSETVSSTVVYNETSVQDVESVTVYWYNDGILYKASGCVCDSCKMDFEANKEVNMAVKLSGIFGGVANITDTAMATPTFGTLQVPPVFQNASMTFESGMGNISKIDITITNKIAKRPDPNATSGVKRVSVVGRDIKGTIDPEMVALATHNPWSSWSAGTAAALSFNLGQTTGNKYTFSLPSVNKDIPKIGARGGVRTYNFSIISNPTLVAGNNRITISHV